MENFLTVVFSFICLIFVLALIRVAYRFIIEIVGPGIITLLAVRLLTMMMEHWMGSTIAWTLSIIAGLWVIYKKVKHLINDPHSFINEMIERENRINRENEEFNRKYSQRGSNADNDDYIKEEVERCDTDKYD